MNEGGCKNKHIGKNTGIVEWKMITWCMWCIERRRARDGHQFASSAWNSTELKQAGSHAYSQR